jgi:hypothetical protein
MIPHSSFFGRLNTSVGGSLPPCRHAADEFPTIGAETVHVFDGGKLAILARERVVVRTVERRVLPDDSLAHQER